MRNSSLITEYEPGITYKFEFPEIKCNINSIAAIDGSIGMYPSIFEFEITMIVHIDIEKLRRLFGEKFMDVIYKKYFNVDRCFNTEYQSFFLIRDVRIVQNASSDPYFDDPYLEMNFITMNGRNLAVQDHQQVLDILHAEARKELDKLTFYAIEKDLCQESTMKRSRQIQSKNK